MKLTKFYKFLYFKNDSQHIFITQHIQVSSALNIDERTINSSVSPARDVLCENCFNMDLMDIVWSELGNESEKESHLITSWIIMNSKRLNLLVGRNDIFHGKLSFGKRQRCSNTCALNMIYYIIFCEL